MGKIVPGLLKKLGIEGSMWLSRIEQEWVETVGAAVAAHARPGTYDGGVITVYVDSSSWLNELKRFGQTEMLKSLKKQFGDDKIRAIRLQLDPEG